MTVGKKLNFAFAGTLALTFALSYSSLRAVRHLGQELDRSVTVTARRMDLAGAISTTLEEMSAHAKAAQFTYVIEKLEAGANMGACSACHTVEMARTRSQEFDAAAARVQEYLAELDPLVDQNEGSSETRSVRAGVEDWVRLYNEYRNLAGQKKFDEAHSIIAGKMLPELAEMHKSAGHLLEQQRVELKQKRERARGDVSRAGWTALLLVGLSLAVSALVLLAVRQAVSSIRGMTRELGVVGSRVADAAANVAQSSDEMAHSTTAQAESLEATSSSGQQVTASAGQNATRTRAVVDVTAEVAGAVEQCRQAVTGMVAAMDGINASSQKISKIIQVIQGIAFQTNILALNAAVEAARAGEAGMGFAVVADEVRNLAQNSAQAARDTESLIQESIGKVGEGRKKLDQVTQTIHSITDGAVHVKSMAEEVKTASLEQANGMDSVAASLRQLRDLNANVAAHARQGAAAGGELKAQADSLREIVGRLDDMVGSG